MIILMANLITNGTNAEVFYSRFKTTNSWDGTNTYCVINSRATFYEVGMRSTFGIDKKDWNIGSC